MHFLVLIHRCASALLVCALFGDPVGSPRCWDQVGAMTVGRPNARLKILNFCLWGTILNVSSLMIIRGFVQNTQLSMRCGGKRITEASMELGRGQGDQGSRVIPGGSPWGFFQLTFTCCRSVRPQEPARKSFSSLNKSVLCT